MKAELKAKVVKAARAITRDAGVLIKDTARVATSPDSYWVQAWVQVDLDFETPKK